MARNLKIKNYKNDNYILNPIKYNIQIGKLWK